MKGRSRAWQSASSRWRGREVLDASGTNKSYACACAWSSATSKSHQPRSFTHPPASDLPIRSATTPFPTESPSPAVARAPDRQNVSPIRFTGACFPPRPCLGTATAAPACPGQANPADRQPSSRPRAASTRSSTRSRPSRTPAPPSASWPRTASSWPPSARSRPSY